MTDPKPTPPMPQLSLPARPPLTPAEEFAALKAPWRQCTWCKTLRKPSSLDAEGACVDTEWCERQLATKLTEPDPEELR